MNIFRDFAGQHVKEGSKYLVDKTFESINELFTASQEIQDWLTVCAKVQVLPVKSSWDSFRDPHNLDTILDLSCSFSHCQN